MLIDSFCRTLDYLRVSITDRCNLRCVYCMPPEGVEWKPHGAILTFEEILRLCRIMAALGIRAVKVTGGEPLLRRGMPPFLKSLKEIPGIEKVTMTTNGLMLGAYLDEAEKQFPDSLPNGINISLNTLNGERFSRISRMAEHSPAEILPLIDRLLAMRITVKINCVAIRSLNEEDILPLAALAQNKDIAVRFIELMPLGSAANLQFIPGNEIAALLEKKLGALTPFTGIPGSGPAVYYRLPDFIGKIGFINAMTHGFCERCNRLRLSSEGFLKLCLSDTGGLNLKGLLRSGVGDAEIAQAMGEIVAQKPRAHSLSQIYGEVALEHPEGMFGIGG